MKFFAGETSPDALEEAFPTRIEALFQRLAVRRGAKQRGHMGRQSQAPKQVLGVVVLHPICEE